MVGGHSRVQIYLPLRKGNAAVIHIGRRMIRDAQIISPAVCTGLHSAGHRKRHIGIASAKQCQHFRRSAPQRRDQKMQMGRLGALWTAQLAHRRIQLMQCCKDLLIKLLACFGQIDAVFSAGKQFCPQFFFQFRNGLGHSRLGDLMEGRRLRDVLQTGNRAKIP